MKLILDLESNALINPTQIWVVVTRELVTGVRRVYRQPTSDALEAKLLAEDLGQADQIIGHNVLAYDLPVIANLLDIKIDVSKVLDTYIISKLVDYPRDGHSVEDYGEEFGLKKINWHDYSKYSVELEEYCIRDVDITYRIYNKYLKYLSNPLHYNSIDIEHRFTNIVNKLESKGFTLDIYKVQRLLDKVHKELSTLDEAILSAFPPRMKLIREITPKETKYGTISLSNIPKHLRTSVSDLSVGSSFSYCEWVEFNPASHKQIITVLNEAGWIPTEKTKAHKEAERRLAQLKRSRERSKSVDIEIQTCHTLLDKLSEYGWKVSESNLSTLPNVEHLILWKDKCRIKISNENDNISKIITKLISKRKELSLSLTTIPIQNLTESDSLKEITASMLPILIDCTNNNPDVARFVEDQLSSWSIIVTKTDIFVDCSATLATDIWVGMRDVQTLHRRISQIQSARTLANRILHEARRRTLQEWLNLVQPDGRVHGKFQAIGAWTHRMAHQKPNMANITNEFDLSDNVKLLGKELRQCWTVPKNRLLVGVDAEGIQLRIFAHYINDPEFTDALVRGKKSDKTDPHSLNQRVIGTICRSRAAAKRYIYAMLLGGGKEQLRSILDCSASNAEVAQERILLRYPGFARLKAEVIPLDAKRGWFVGLDGRRVRILGDTESQRRHLAMSGYLQNGEVVVIKHAAVIAEPQIESLDSFFVNIVHDEYQVETPNEMRIALQVAEIIDQSIRSAGVRLGLHCPLAGSYYNDAHKDYTIGRTWYHTH